MAFKYQGSLAESVSHLCGRGKGILAADESPGTLGKRLKNTPELSHLENVEETRRQYREILVTSETGSCFGGIILHEETLLQSTKDGKPFVEILKGKGVLPGIKVDQGLAPLGEEETVTKGLDTLEERCAKYREQGARFAKWRSALKVTGSLPSRQCIEENAEQLARYARICQEQGLVPIVEPEILITSDYDMARSREVSTQVLKEVVRRLQEHKVDMKLCLLKPQMVMPGSDCPTQAGSDEVAAATLDVFDECLPGDLAGVFFLSGGLTEEQATVNLNKINLLARERYNNAQPWKLSFSFGRALQASVLKLWKGDPSNAPACREQSLALAQANSKACEGLYQPPHPSPSTASLVETFRGHQGQQPN
ncbi:fructose-1,6-bisphosphate aldolase [Chloropicon primus]|uniref:fructose-bisphosphate aldolase n=1 Tax=Chloropicon primus TaxID=1764295 RepID=A0A5B8MRF2_9CHLO|nr:fructose-1,6-bisphosphate aldolase [Chloropicon primus]UPR02188.1 fructose-1,6-bisphosphate aldolase [Chloropicon primus]|mmetsp:Transcript_10348/g.29328  ORF Transcript_10348/g.29328 Transcript_10348/m.29328 type:complete len:367 (+) Transcript_10348:211-1311(+)|eukprot:QDZ22971.1 fructose-1,6-bisphosphate aldolase [Chloropicon primus]